MPHLRPITVYCKTMEDALHEAQTKGFELIQSDARTYQIDEFLEELALETETESPLEYTLLQNVIVRLADIGSRNAEVYHLD